MRRSKVVVALFALLFFLPLLSKAGTEDSARVLTREAFIAIVQQYHPVVRSAALDVARADARILQARGAFDPVAAADFDRKTFDGKLYYRYLNPELSIPTWYGLELVAGVEEAIGDRINPERTPGGLSYAGAKLNLSGLWLDNRRAILRSAQAVRTQTEAERRLAVNAVMYDALSAYFSWQQAVAVQQIFIDGIANAEERLRLIRIEVEQGARAPIDTVEALTQLQSIQLLQTDALLGAQNRALDLFNFLWLDGGQPLPLIDNTRFRPELSFYRPEVAALENLLAAGTDHPKLQALRAKLDVLDIERALKRTYLLPKMSVKGTAISGGYATLPETTAPMMENNSKISADFTLPLFLREARGALRETGLKIDQTGIELDATELAVQNKIRAAYNSFFALRRQEEIAAAAVENYQRLYNGELLKYETGESTVFLLNARQNKVIESLIKLAELRAKVGKAEAEILFAAGLLG